MGKKSKNSSQWVWIAVGLGPHVIILAVGQEKNQKPVQGDNAHHGKVKKDKHDGQVGT